MSHRPEESQTLTRRAVLTGSAAALTGIAGIEGQLRATEPLGIPLRVFMGGAQDAEPVLDDLDQDPNMVSFLTLGVNPLLRQLAAGLEATPQFSGPLPTIALSDSDIALLRQQMVTFIQMFLEQTSTQALGPKDLEAVIAAAINRLETVLSKPSIDPELAIINQRSDFSAAIVGNVYVALDQGGTGAVILSPVTPISQDGSSPDWTDSQWILIAGLTVELIALLAAVAGVVLPKVPLGPVVKALLPFLKQPVVRQALTELLATLALKTASLADKGTAILKFLAILSNVGALGRLLDAFFSGLSVVDLLVVVVQIGIIVTAFLIPASTAATVARITAVLLAALKELIQKVAKLH